MFLSTNQIIPRPFRFTLLLIVCFLLVPTSALAQADASHGAIEALMLQPSGTRFYKVGATDGSGWLYSPDANQTEHKGDFDNDNQMDILVTSAWGIGILIFSGNTFESLMLQPNGTRFYKVGATDGSGWLYDSDANTIEAIGDFNGDGRSDILLTSEWGIGLLTLVGDTFQSLMLQPNGTRFYKVGATDGSGWLYDSDSTTIEAIGDFNGDGRSDILVTSGWGIGLLTLVGDTFQSLMLQPNGTRFYKVGATDGSGWFYDSDATTIEAIGDFNGDGRTDILVTSEWGIGLLTLVGDTFQSLILQPNGTRFYKVGATDSSGWLYSSDANTIEAIGDFNGDGRTDILVTSGWGIGLLTLAGDTFQTLMLQPNGTRFYKVGATDGSGWLYDSGANTIEAIGDFNANGQSDILVTSGWGIGFLELSGSTFVSLLLQPNGTRFYKIGAGDGSGWLYSSIANTVELVDDFNDDDQADILVSSAWGIGLLTMGAPFGRAIDLSVSLYRTVDDEDTRDAYESILEHLADAVYEMTNGAHRIGTVTIYQNGEEAERADIAWRFSEWPHIVGACISGFGQPGCQIYFGDNFPFPDSPYDVLRDENNIGAGYAIAHEFGHLYYGLYDEYPGDAPCNGEEFFFTPQVCDIMVENSVMGNPWAATDGDLNWLNFATALNWNEHNVTDRVYETNAWDILVRPANEDPRDGQRIAAAARTFFSELQFVAPEEDVAPSIELPTTEAHEYLRFVWVETGVGASGHSLHTAQQNNLVLRSINGNTIFYPTAAEFTAVLRRDGGAVTNATVRAIVTQPDQSTFNLVFHDDGNAPDAIAYDGIYAAILPYKQNGQHQITVTFTNDEATAEISYVGNHYVPGPNGEDNRPQSQPLSEPFSEQATLSVMVEGYPPAIGVPALPIVLTADNYNVSGRIDTPGDQDLYEFHSQHSETLVLRVTDYALAMKPHIQLFKNSTEPVLIEEFQYEPDGQNYFFTELDVAEDESYQIKISHLDATAGDGFYKISLGPALSNSIEQPTSQPESFPIYLPLIVRQ